MYKISKRVASIPIDSLKRLGLIDDLNLEEYRVLMILLSQIDGVTYQKIDKSQLAETLNIKKKKIDTAITNLVDLDVLRCGSNDHVKKGYKFNL